VLNLVKRMTLAVLVAVFLGAGLGMPQSVFARGDLDTVVRLSELPPEAADTHRRMLTGGPFRYPNKDGTVFGNRERLLPREARGYYREYTVPTPGSRDRGARRLICGGREPTTPDVCYYTQDHYASFRRIAP
jgi:ribonuclease T1